VTKPGAFEFTATASDVAGAVGPVPQIAEAFARCAPAVRRFFSRRVASKSDIDDLTQEVFTNLLRRAEGCEPVANVEGYIFQVAANLLTSRARQQMRRRALDGDALDQDWAKGNEGFTPERILLGREACREVVAALHELPERVRTVFVLNRFEELSGIEIARRLNVSVSTVEKAMMRALAHLKERLR
jgi:RNA polymerase sigma-70 factor (ECF subfamily)